MIDKENLNKQSLPQEKSKKNSILNTGHQRVQIESIYNYCDQNLEMFFQEMVNEKIEGDLVEFFNSGNYIYLWTSQNELKYMIDSANFDRSDGQEIQQLIMVAKDQFQKLNFSTIEMNNDTKSIQRKMDEVIFNNIHIDCIPSNIKNNLITETLIFLIKMSEQQQNKEESLTLFIPNTHLLKYLKINSKQESKSKEILQRNELLVQHWIKFLKEFIHYDQNKNSQDLMDPLREIEDIKIQLNAYKQLTEQLNKRLVQKCLDLLKQFNSSCYDEYQELMSQMNHLIVKNTTSLRYLKVLEKYCQILNQVSLEEVPNILNKLFFSVRYLFENCKYYESHEKIANIFRKITHRIITKCIKKINLDWIFFGKVNLCVDQVKLSQEICEKWKNCYVRNLKIMKKKPLEIDQDTIFAQMEAFQQRCNDLIEICLCVYQFSYDGDDRIIPIFGGNKGIEIEEKITSVQKQFKNFMKKLHENKEIKILDIKSTKWHDHFNSLKNQMKKLDNILINIIDFAFDNQKNIKIVIQYLRLFHCISYRQNIKMYLAKKLEFLESLIQEEMDKVEQKANGLVGQHSQQIKKFINWLVRIENIRNNFIKLNWISEIDKYRILNNLKNIKNELESNIQSILKDFKEQNKNIESFIRDKMQQNILIMEKDFEQDESIKHHALQISNQNFIMCNFDNKLNLFIKEYHSLSEINKINLPNFGSFVESFMTHNVPKLQGHMKNVMKMVRQYNRIQKLVNSRERNLFSEYLTQLKTTVSRGIKILRWTSQGTFDNFLGECYSKCISLKEKIEMFKKAKYYLIKKIDLTAKNLILIDYNQRRLDEYNTFVKNQQKAFQNNGRSIDKLFNQIRIIINQIYENFVHCDIKVHEEWFKFIEYLDKRIIQRIKNAFRIQLEQFFNVISGDEKTKTNPCQLFRFHLDLVDQAEQQILKFNPNLKNFKKKIKNTIENQIELFKNHKRLIYVHRIDRDSKIQKLLDSKKKNKKKIKFFKNKSIEYVDIKEIVDGKDQKEYVVIFEKQVKEIKSKILDLLEKHLNKTRKQLEPWKKNIFLKMRSGHYQTYTESLVKNESSIQNLSNAIIYYENMQQEIQGEKSQDDTICIQVDPSELKSKLININYEEQKNLLCFIKNDALTKVKYMTDMYDQIKNQLVQKVSTQKNLSNNMEQSKLLKREMRKIKNQVEPLKKRFILLDDYMMIFNEKETQQRNLLKNIESMYSSLSKSLEKQIDEDFKQMKEEHEELIIKYSTEVLNNYQTIQQSLPTKSEQVNHIEALDNLKSIQDTYKNLIEKQQKMQYGISLFKISYNSPPHLSKIQKLIKNCEEFWDQVKLFKNQLNNFLNFQISAIDIDEIKKIIKKTELLIQEMDESILAWEVFSSFKVQLKKELQILEIIQNFKDQCIKKRHEMQINKLIGVDVDQPLNELTLQIFKKNQVVDFKGNLDKIYSKASAEFKVEKSLDQIKIKWEELHFELKMIDTKISIKFLDSFKMTKIMDQLEEDLMKLSVLQSNAYSVFFKDQILKQENQLQNLNQILDLIILVQKKYLYFQSIFNNIKGEVTQLKGDKSKFNEVKDVFMNYIKKINQDTLILKILNYENLEDKINFCLSTLEIIQKNLKKYVVKKKLEIPRIYFLSDKNIFQLLGNTHDKATINKFLSKMFFNLKKAEFSQLKNFEAYDEVYSGVMAQCGEILEFNSPIYLSQNLQNQILSIQDNIKENLNILFYSSLNFFKSNRIGLNKDSNKFSQWINKYQGQVLLMTIQLVWTQEVDTFVSQFSKDQSQVKKKNFIISRTQQRLLSEMISFMKKKPSQLQKKKIVSGIIIMVHQKDINEKIQANYCPFDWESQLKYYQKIKNNHLMDIKINHYKVQYDYGYEYQGNNGRLVITPLTDKCYLTLTNAIYHQKGGCPQGPAGTGKTETVKDLAKNLAKSVYVFNCSDDLKVSNIINILEGLVINGFWGCFDEFNRMTVEVLSFISIQIRQIFEAIHQNISNIKINNRQLPLNKNYAIFITMNPGYVGRSVLPDNISQLFRPISMLKPDTFQICKISLMAEGFKHSEILAKDIERFFRQLKINLSKQQHYDFGLRSIKSVLNLSGNLRRIYRSSVSQHKNDIQFEKFILSQSINILNEPQMVNYDQIIYEQNLQNIFSVENSLQREFDNKLLKAIDKTMDKMNIDKNSIFIDKLIQFNEIKKVRHGVIMIGQAMSSKTMLVKTLQKIYENLKKKVVLKFINPKIFNNQQLYGYFDEQKDQYISGLVFNILQKYSQEFYKNHEIWLVFDGPLDTIWVENMNSLLDDNKILTCSNGDRIKLKDNIRLIFQVTHLQHISPATITRCGMMYFNSQFMNWRSIKLAWMLRLDDQSYPDQLLDFLEDMFDKWVDPSINFLKKNPHLLISNLSETNLCTHLSKLFMKYYNQIMHKKIPQSKFQELNNVQLLYIEKIFLYSLVWSFGVIISNKGRKIFDNYLRDIENMYPFTNTVFDYYLDPVRVDFDLWKNQISLSSQQINKINNFKNVLIDTPRSLQFKQFIKDQIEINSPILIIGQSSSGKSLLLNNVFNSLDSKNYQKYQINVTYSMDSHQLLQNIMKPLNKSIKRKLVPTLGRRGIVLIEDLHLNSKDQFEISSMCEQLRFLIEQKRSYSKDDLEREIQISGVQFLGTINNLTAISDQLKNKFYNYYLSPCQEDQLCKIYQVILQSIFKQFDPEQIKSQLTKTSKFLANLLINLQEEPVLSKNYENPHYTFSTKDITRVIKGMSCINKFYCDSQQIYYSLLINECQSVLEDKLRGGDRIIFQEILKNTFEENFNFNLEEYQECRFTYLFSSNSIYSICQGQDYRSQIKEQIGKVIKELTSTMPQQQILQFKSFEDNFIKIMRVLKQQNEHLILTGFKGTGRKTILQLVAKLLEINVYFYKGENYTIFREEIKNIVQVIKETSQKFVILAEEQLIDRMSVLEDLYVFMKQGYFEDIFTEEEFKEMKIKNLKEFNELVSVNLKVVLVCSNQDKKLQNLLDKFPSIAYNTTCIYFNNWTDDIYYEIAKVYLGDNNVSNQKNARFMTKIHEQVKGFYKDIKDLNLKIKPSQSQFKRFIHFYQNLKKNKKQSIKEQIRKYENGLEKLEYAKVTVENLKQEMDLIKFDLQNKKNQQEKIVAKIKKEKQNSQSEKEMIEDKDKVLQEEKSKIMQLAEEAKEQLEKAMPALIEADKQVQNLDSQSMSTIKSFLKTKDKRLQLIMFSLMVLLKEKPDWSTVQKVVVDANFLKRIRDIDKDKITEERVMRLEKFTQQPEIQGNLEKYSSSVHILKQYIMAVEAYVKINLDVLPIKLRIKKLQDELKDKESLILQLKEKYRKNLEQLDDLNVQNDQMEAEYQKSEQEYNELEMKLVRAKKLVQSLESSHTLWNDNLEQQKLNLGKAEGNCLLASMGMTYLGILNRKQRNQLIEFSKQQLKENNILFDQEIDFVSFLIKEVDILRWQMNGLPKDSYFSQNACITYLSQNVLVVDPVNQSLEWITQTFSKFKNFEKIDNFSNFENQLKEALIKGKIILLRNVQKHHQHLIRQALVQNGDQQDEEGVIIEFSGQSIKKSKNFKLILQSQNQNVDFDSEILSQLNIINFSLQLRGLEEQILNLIMEVTDKTLEMQRINCINTKFKCSIVQQELEDKILDLLQQERKKLIIDDLELIDALEESKKKQEELNINITVNKSTLQKLSKSRENFRKLSQMGAQLFFILKQLQKVNNNYYIGLSEYFSQFKYNLQQIHNHQQEMMNTYEQRLSMIINKLRYKLFEFFQMRLFKDDQLLLAFLFAMNKDNIIEEQYQDVSNDNLIEKKQMINFLIDKQLGSIENLEENPNPLWITDEMWRQLVMLEKLVTFQGIQNSVIHSGREWRNIYKQEKPESVNLPSDWTDKLKGFSKILLIKALRPDRLKESIKNYISNILLPKYLINSSLNFEEINHNSQNLILFLTRGNVNPQILLDQIILQYKVKISQLSFRKINFQSILERIVLAIKEKKWIFLENIHYSPKLISLISQITQHLVSEKYQFRIIMSCDGDYLLPQELLKDSIIYSFQEQNGMKNSMKKILSRTLVGNEQQDVRESNQKYVYQRLLYTMAWFHSMINQRNKFYSMGWNHQYRFSEADFLFNEQMIKQVCFSNKKLDWNTIRNLICNINYGGKITDLMDKKLMKILSEEFFIETLAQEKPFILYSYQDQSLEVPVFTQQNSKNKNKNLSYSNIISQIMNFVEKIPDQDNPEIFGQHYNAELKMKIKDSQKLLQSLKKINEQSIDQVVVSDQIQSLEIFEKLIQNLPEKIDIELFLYSIKRQYKTIQLALKEPLNSFYIQEAEKINSIIDVVKQDLESIMDFLRGKTEKSQKLNDIKKQIENNETPTSWQDQYLSPLQLNKWIIDLQKRAEQISKIMSRSHISEYWLAGFISPLAFLCAYLQTFAKKEGNSYEQYEWSLKFHEIENSTEKKEAGIIVKDIYLEGGSWDIINNCLQDSQHMILFQKMPVFLLKPILKKQQNSKISTYNCPIYKTVNRRAKNNLSSLVTTLKIPYQSKDYNENFWIKRGTAILLQIDY